jgi:hypothetical protein
LMATKIETQNSKSETWYFFLREKRLLLQANASNALWRRHLMYVRRIDSMDRRRISTVEKSSCHKRRVRL